MIKELRYFGCEVDVSVWGPDSAIGEDAYGISLSGTPQQCTCPDVLVAVSHREYATMNARGLLGYLKADRVPYHHKSMLTLGGGDVQL